MEGGAESAIWAHNSGLFELECEFFDVPPLDANNVLMYLRWTDFVVTVQRRYIRNGTNNTKSMDTPRHFEAKIRVKLGRGWKRALERAGREPPTVRECPEESLL